MNTVAVQSSIRYRGYVYDYETGLYYLQSRYYDPEVGRFLNADDVDFIGYSGEQLSYNMFAYCENNVVNGIDMYGYWGYDVHAGYNKKETYKKITYGMPEDCAYPRKIPYFIYKKERYYYGTYYWALISGFEETKTSRRYALIIAEACNDVDTIFSPFSTSVSNQSWHFNTNGKSKQDSRFENASEYMEKAKKYFDKAMKAYKNKKSFKKNVKQGCTYFGYALHALQDYYAHSADKCHYIMLPTTFGSTGLNNGKSISFQMHLPGLGVDKASKRIDELEYTAVLTILLLVDLFKDYRKVLIKG